MTEGHLVAALEEHVLIVFTGGTISVSPSRDSNHPALGGAQLAGEISGFSEVPIQTVDLYRAMSESLTFPHLHKLVTFLRQAMDQPAVRGVVVSHGTDTMDEVSYLVDLVGPWSKPIVFTGAMRHNELVSADGPANLVNAIRVADTSASIGRGVMVVMNEEIHAARYVVKGHSTNVSSFSSPGAGLMGSVVEECVRYYWSVPPYTTSYRLPALHSWPKVELIRMTLGNSGLFLRACLAEQVDGVVIEGFGAGHVPEFLLPDIQKLIDAGVRVRVVPRTASGHPLYATYGTPGSEIGLQSMGVTMEEGPGHKARIRMMLELAGKE